jgi:glycosyltransferase involved in cell wall biosynthesis
MRTAALHIAIDARPAAHPQPGGFKTYTRNLLAGLARLDEPADFRLYVDRPLADLALDRRFRVELLPTPALPVVGAAWREQVLLPARLRSEPADLLHLPSGTGAIWSGAPLVATIHDAIEQMPESITGVVASAGGPKRRLMHLYNSAIQRLIGRQARLVITQSECSRRDIVRYLGLPASKIRVVPLAPSPHFGQLAEVAAPSEPFILAIASADPRKNLVGLLRAYAALPADLRRQYRLTMVWTHPLLQERLLEEAARQGIADRITSITRPSNAELCRLYNQATAFVFPSLYEGFGLPPIEAMACGTPVVASNTASLPEVLGDAALLADPRSPTALAGALEALLANRTLREDLGERGLQRARQYSWERTAAETLAIYREAVGESPREAINHISAPAKLTP